MVGKVARFRATVELVEAHTEGRFNLLGDVLASFSGCQGVSLLVDCLVSDLAHRWSLQGVVWAIPQT